MAGSRIVVGIIGTLALSALSGCGSLPGTDAAGEPVAVQSEALALAGVSTGARHDYDGDGVQDLLFITDQGSFVMMGARRYGGFNQGWTNGRSGFLSGQVSYTAGDFNGNGQTDLIVTNASGSSEYIANPANGAGWFKTNVWSDPTLTLNNVEFTVGDFNGDSHTDMIVTTASGSSLYLGSGSGTTVGGFSTNVWTNSSLTLHNVVFTPGNFNGDLATDVLVTTQSSTYELVGQTGAHPGVFANGPWSFGYTVNNYQFTTGDFNGDGKSDVIVQSVADAVLWYGDVPYGLSGGSSIGADHNASGGPPTVGDFDHDGRSDIITQGSGASGTGAYLQSGLPLTGGFSTPTLIDNRFGGSYDWTLSPGDFDGDGWDDFVALGKININNPSAATITETVHHPDGSWWANRWYTTQWSKNNSILY